MKRIKLSDLIAPSFYSVHENLKQRKYTHYWLKGGRGSTKSSFVSLEIILGIMQDPQANAVILRKVGKYLKDSVYEQLIWAVEKLGVSQYWHVTKSPLELTYVPTGQKVLFRGADEPKKIKSTKFSRGYSKYIWYEEVDEFHGMEEIRTINQSLMRGGERFVVFYSFNPPQSVRNWVNSELINERPDRLVHHSTYLDVPRKWLGEPFIVEAEHLKKVNEKAYRHEYLGEVTGTGLEIFTNVTLRKITDEEIKTFDRIKQGLDFGYTVDPVAFIKLHYDKTRRKLYLFYEFSGIQVSNRKLYKSIKNHLGNVVTVADSSEPKSIAELKSYGMKIKGAKKGPDSVDYGIKFLSEHIDEIIIDPERCPRAAKEFINYSLETDRNGEVISEYPDKDNHTIDAVRYALEDDMINNKIEFLT